MKLCLISPMAGLQKYAMQSEGVHLALVHLVEQSKEYVDFYRSRSEAGDTILLDNGAFEFGFPCPTDRLIKAAEKIKAHVLVAPDYPGQPWEKTLISTEDFCNEVRKTPYAVMGCPQSEIGDWRGWLESFRQMGTIDSKLSHIAVSILATPNAFGGLVGNHKDIELCRLMATVLLKDSIKSKHLNFQNKKIHYLGAGHRLDLLQYYDIADSLDTSSPVWHGWNGIRYDYGFLPKGKIALPVDFHAKFENANVANHDVQDAMINSNIVDLKKWARKSEVGK